MIIAFARCLYYDYIMTQLSGSALGAIIGFISATGFALYTVTITLET